MFLKTFKATLLWYAFSCFLTVIFFPKNIQRSFTLIRPLKKIENHKSCCHLYYAIQTKLYLNRREEHFVVVEITTFSLLKEYKKIIFCRFVEPCQYYKLSFQSTWPSDYLKITFIIIKAHLNKKTCWNMFLQLWFSTWSAKFSFR